MKDFLGAGGGIGLFVSQLVGWLRFFYVLWVNFGIGGFGNFILIISKAILQGIVWGAFFGAIAGIVFIVLGVVPFLVWRGIHAK